MIILSPGAGNPFGDGKTKAQVMPFIFKVGHCSRKAVLLEFLVFLSPFNALYK